MNLRMNLLLSKLKFGMSKNLILKTAREQHHEYIEALTNQSLSKHEYRNNKNKGHKET